jgi:hypothetical protein
MRQFTLLILALALPWLLLTAAFAPFNVGYRDNLRVARFPQQHAHHVGYDLLWEVWLPFHHLDSTGVRLLGTGDSFTNFLVQLAHQHLPTSTLPHQLEARANRGIISTARASRCLIAEVDSGQFTDFLFVNVERGFLQIGRYDHPGCDPETPVRPRATMPDLAPSDAPPTPQTSLPLQWADYWKIVRSHSIRDVFDFFWYNSRRALFPNLPEDLPSFTMPASYVPMTCGLDSEALESSNLFSGPDAGELINALDLINAYHAARGRNAYTHGDTHWSLTGAGLAFRELLKRVTPAESFSPSAASSSPLQRANFSSQPPLGSLEL